MPVFSNSLKARFMLAIVTTVTISSFLFALSVVSIKNRLEEATFGDMVSEQLAVILDTGHDHSDVDLLSDWEFHEGAEIAALPEEIRSLPVGSHHSIRVDDRYYQVEAAIADGQPVFLSYDITAWEEQEHALLAWLGYGIAGMLLIALLLAWLATRAGLRPLNALTSRLAAINPDKRKLQIAAEFEGHEVGAIAREFDRYLKRLDEFVEREKFFSAAASHELRTPLSVIIGAVDVIEARQTDTGSSKALQRIRRACLEMLAFIEATLFLSREDYQFNEQASDCDVRQIVRDALLEHEAQLETRDIEVRFSPSAPLLLRQQASVIKIVINNILKNAIEHSSHSQINILLENNAIVFSDSGEGIAEDDLGRVFEKSFTTKSDGTGLGLTLVKKICDRLNWQIEINSTRGMGTTVRVIFGESGSGALSG
ncbi:MAG: HAMP domain-containing histidine kinase [Pseudomonadales bacterium]|nr:HAMP domain-containing histidine kinase [Pseudomonadales bacterium]